MKIKNPMTHISLVTWGALLVILVSEANNTSRFDILSWIIGIVTSIIVLILVALFSKKSSEKSNEFRFTLVTDETLVIIFEGTLAEFETQYKVPKDDYNDAEYFSMIEDFAMENGLRVVARQYGLK
jgi:hypothetical protein